MGKIKNHFEKNGKLYIGIGVGAAVGVATSVILRQPKVVGALSKNQVVALLAWKPVQKIEVVVEALGDPGNVIQEVTDGVRGTVFANQNSLAKHLGVNPARISEHINGKLPNINGRTFEKLGKAIVA